MCVCVSLSAASSPSLSLSLSIHTHTHTPHTQVDKKEAAHMRLFDEAAHAQLVEQVWVGVGVGGRAGV